MYLKILRGGVDGYDPKKLASYLFRESASAEHVSSNLFISDHSDSAQVADAFNRHHSTHAARNGGSAKRIKRPIVHIIARAAPEDGELSAESLKKLSKRTLETLGLNPRDYPYLAQSHADELGVRNHLHIIASRISNDGKSVWYGRTEGEMCWRAKTTLEKELGLHRTEAMDEFKAEQRKTLRRTEPEQQMKKREAISNKEVIGASILASLEDSGGKWEAFAATLRKYQIEVEKVERASGHHGVIFRFNGLKISGSKLGRSFSYSQLVKTLSEIESGRVKGLGGIGLAVTSGLLEKQEHFQPKQNCDPSRKKLEFDKSQLEDLRKVERGRYPDLSALAGSLFASYSLQQSNIVVFVICMLMSRSMVAEYKRRERHRSQDHSKRRVDR